MRNARSVRVSSLLFGLAVAVSACSSSGGSSDTTAAAEMTVAETAAVVESTTVESTAAETTAAGATDAASVTAAPSDPTPTRMFGVPTEAGRGLVEGWSANGSALLVSAVDDKVSEEGCEGQPEPVLFLQPTDGTARRLAYTDDRNATTGPILGRTSDGKVALLESCEGFTGAVALATEAPDGSLSNIREVSLETVGLRFPAIALSFDGTALVMAEAALEGSEMTLTRVDLASGKVVDKGVIRGTSTGVQDIAELADGRYVLNTGSSVATIKKAADGSGFEGEATESQGIGAVLNGGRSIAVLNGDELRIDGGEPVFLPAKAASAMVKVSPDGRSIAILGFDSGNEATSPDGFVAVVTAGKVHLVAERGSFGRLEWSPDSSAIAYNSFSPDMSVETVLVAKALNG